MKFGLYSIASALLLFGGSVKAESNNDHGQYHHHKPKLDVKEYKKKDGPVTVHIVPHSHDDVGWKNTVEEYFDGMRNDIQWTNVRVELSSVINAL